MRMFLFLLFCSAFCGIILGCSLSYKPEVRDSEIYHQSGNKPKADVDLNIRSPK